jgi:hypothetical protein
LTDRAEILLIRRFRFEVAFHLEQPRLTSDPGDGQTHHAWSPDGSRITFSSERERPLSGGAEIPIPGSPHPEVSRASVELPEGGERLGLAPDVPGGCASCCGPSPPRRGDDGDDRHEARLLSRSKSSRVSKTGLGSITNPLNRGSALTTAARDGLTAIGSTIGCFRGQEGVERGGNQRQRGVRDARRATRAA